MSEGRVALVYPPTCDPTAPYLAVPMLTGFLRAHGVEVLPIDANLEAFDDLLSERRMTHERHRLEERLGALDRRAELRHEEQLEYASLVHARAEAHAVPGVIERAKRVLREEASFFDPDVYASAVTTIEAALRVVSATYHPLHLDFTAYRTPFGLTTMEEIQRASGPDADPFHAYVTESLVPRLRAARCDVVGLSVCFPGQLQPAYAFALAIKRAMPEAHLTCGGPGITQMLIRLSGERLARALGPFDSACVYEGERTLLALVRALGDKRPLRDIPNVVVRDRLMGARWLAGHGMEDPRTLPAPDFDGLPLDRYLAPALVLPYDPTRGCYWGKCTFCHYGLAEVGTASYRERDIAVVVEHLHALKLRHGTRWFYFSQDSVAPKTILKLSEAIVEAGLDVRWATDLKPEKFMTAKRAETLRKSGAVACALGVESAVPRVLELIDKGAPPEVVGDVIDNLAGAGIAAEAMCFTEFPTETHVEALETLEFLAARRDEVAVFIVGEFGLSHGSLVAQEPSRFGIAETWELEGDHLGLGIFFAPTHPWKTDEERANVDARLDALSCGWALRTYPWAGAVSTAHTLLYYERYGPCVFKDLARRGPNPHDEGVLGAARFERQLRFDPARCARASEIEGDIWASLVTEERRVSRIAYEAHTSRVPALGPRPSRVVFAVGAPPMRARGRRLSTAPNAARS
jgi:anaerobic magnesium-protoporphyrin IX monomethyl ester cyclase